MSAPAVARCTELGHLASAQTGMQGVPVQPTVDLTASEMRIVSLVAQGLDDAEIASILGEAEHEIKVSVERLIAKAGVRNRVELALFALERFAQKSAQPGLIKTPLEP